jgi:hypothetical protein
MNKKGSEVSPLVATAIITLVLGGIGGYFFRAYQDDGAQSTASASSAQAPGGAGGRGGAPGGPGGGSGGGGGGGFGGGQGQAQNGAALARLVRGLSAIQKAQNKGLTTQQAASLRPVLKQLQAAEKIPDKDAEARVTQIEKSLTAEQKEALAALQPQRGGGGGGFGGGGGGGFGGGGMGSGGGRPTGSGGPVPAVAGSAGGPGGAGGNRPDPEKPFATERNKKALEDLIASLGSK